MQTKADRPINRRHSSQTVYDFLRHLRTIHFTYLIIIAAFLAIALLRSEFSSPLSQDLDDFTAGYKDLRRHLIQQQLDLADYTNGEAWQVGLFGTLKEELGRQTGETVRISEDLFPDLWSFEKRPDNLPVVDKTTTLKDVEVGIRSAYAILKFVNSIELPSDEVQKWVADESYRSGASGTPLINVSSIQLYELADSTEGKGEVSMDLIVSNAEDEKPRPGDDSSRISHRNFLIRWKASSKKLEVSQGLLDTRSDALADWWDQNPNALIGTFKAELERWKEKNNEQELDAFGLKIKGQDLAKFLPAICISFALVILIYEAALLAFLRRHNESISLKEMLSPWFGVMESQASAFFTYATIGLLPIISVAYSLSGLTESERFDILCWEVPVSALSAIAVYKLLELRVETLNDRFAEWILASYVHYLKLLSTNISKRLRREPVLSNSN